LDLVTEITLLVIAAFVGFQVISRVPNTLHTPLMSATNAIHGIVVLGGILLIGEVHGTLDKALCLILHCSRGWLWGTIGNVAGCTALVVVIFLNDICFSHVFLFLVITEGHRWGLTHRCPSSQHL